MTLVATALQILLFCSKRVSRRYTPCAMRCYRINYRLLRNGADLDLRIPKVLSLLQKVVASDALSIASPEVTRAFKLLGNSDWLLLQKDFVYLLVAITQSIVHL